MKTPKFLDGLAWRWRLPAAVVGFQLLVYVVLRGFFSASHSRPLEWFFLLVEYPFLGNRLLPVIWLALLYTIGWFVEKRVERKA